MPAMDTLAPLPVPPPSLPSSPPSSPPPVVATLDVAALAAEVPDAEAAAPEPAWRGWRSSLRGMS